MEQLVHSGADPLSSLRQQHDFNQAGRADTHALSAPNSVIEDLTLLARQFLGICEPPDHDVGVEEKSRIQEAGSSSRLSASQRSEVSKLTISPVISSFPAKIPLGDFHPGFFAAETVATGRPRFLPVIVPPCSWTSSSSARHLALNSVAPMTRFFIPPSYRVSRWSSDQ